MHMTEDAHHFLRDSRGTSLSHRSSYAATFRELPEVRNGLLLNQFSSQTSQALADDLPDCSSRFLKWFYPQSSMRRIVHEPFCKGLNLGAAIHMGFMMYSITILEYT